MRRGPERRRCFRRFNKPTGLGYGNRIRVNPPDTGRQRGGHERIPRAVGVRKQGGAGLSYRFVDGAVLKEERLQSADEAVHQHEPLSLGCRRGRQRALIDDLVQREQRREAGAGQIVLRIIILQAQFIDERLHAGLGGVHANRGQHGQQKEIPAGIDTAFFRMLFKQPKHLGEAFVGGDPVAGQQRCAGSQRLGVQRVARFGGQHMQEIARGRPGRPRAEREKFMRREGELAELRDMRGEHSGQRAGGQPFLQGLFGQILEQMEHDRRRDRVGFPQDGAGELSAERAPITITGLREQATP